MRMGLFKIIVHECHWCYLVKSAKYSSHSRVHLVSVGARLELNEDMIGTTIPASFQVLAVASLPAILLGVQDCSDLLLNWGGRYRFRGSLLGLSCCDALYFTDKGLNIRVIPTTKCNHASCVHSGTVNQTLARTPFIRLQGSSLTTIHEDTWP